MDKEKKKQRILLVDDIDENIKLLGTFLKEKYNIAIANNGEKAYNLAKSFKPDLTLMDINMPIMNGYDSAKLILEDPEIPEHPLIFITALADRENAIKGFDIGAVDYVTKPIDLKVLEKRMSLHLSLKKSQEIIQKQNAQLKDHVDTKNKFFSIVSHDLKSPFGGLLNLTELMHDNFDMFTKEDIKENLDGLLTTIRQLYSFVEKLLDWSRLQTSKVQLRKRELVLNEFIEETILLYKNNSDAKNIDVEFLEEKKYIAYTDPNIFDTILRNLISNAIKFSYKKGKISVRLEEEEDYYAVTIADKGTGISLDSMDKIFSLDKHNLEVGTNNEKGTGLGLVISKEMVELQGGKIRVESIENEGTKFIFTVPKKKFEVK